MRLEERYDKVLAWFRERMPVANTELQYNDPFQLLVYGAQNEAYMSRSAEKWVRGLCFNELGVCG